MASRGDNCRGYIDGDVAHDDSLGCSERFLAADHFHDLRHTAATKKAPNDTSEATMNALLGHMSKTMIEHYSRNPS
jgi:hypothetical protein